MATHSSILAWKIPMTEESGRLQSMGLQRLRHDWVTEHVSIYVCVCVCKTNLLYTWNYQTGTFIFQCHIFFVCLFILFMEFSKQEYWSGLPFTSPVECFLSELSIMIHPFWMALQGIAHSFIELDKAMIHVISLVNFLWLWFLFCWLSDG